MIVSIHAPHEGERLDYSGLIVPAGKFQSTLPTRGSDKTALDMDDGIYTFQSTLPTRGSDFCIFQRQHIAVDVSIHAPHEGERLAFGLQIHCGLAGFNPRSPRGGAT